MPAGWAFGYFQNSVWAGFADHAILGKSPSRRRRGRFILKQLQSTVLIVAVSTKVVKLMPNMVAMNLRGHGARSHEPGFRTRSSVALVPGSAGLVVATPSDGQQRPVPLSQDMGMRSGVNDSAETCVTAWPKAGT